MSGVRQWLTFSRSIVSGAGAACNDSQVGLKLPGWDADGGGMNLDHLLEVCRPGAFCALCYSGRRGRKVYPGHFGFRPGAPRRRSPCMAIHRRSAPAAGGSESALTPRSQGEYWDRLPAVLEFLSASRWPDGASRSTGTVMVFFEAGFWKCWVHDRDAAQGAFLSARTLPELMQEVEEAVATGKGDWRADRKGSGRKG
jgi:hypothetical protein